MIMPLTFEHDWISAYGLAVMIPQGEEQFFTEAQRYGFLKDQFSPDILLSFELF